MKLSEYAKSINELVKKHPDAEVVYSIDEEGNVFKPVIYTPTAGTYSNGEFSGEEDSEDRGVIAVCVN